ncbi:HAMP domain-containing sensor histidine kinase [Paenibacillus antarcticus]|uniref:Heme sensor protein HssS n=1 Tax=Paenibacillus antarcticus TaxID=253703 RepID=A0A168QPI2_9BACL|nr:HAMP domain-containing sensor histidine kinase [Paenibacillus antarcticus]OAB48032.1 two-component sensor histidine kinase [Paenibacillus antarcticus]
MIKNNNRSLWWSLVSLVFVSMLASSLLMALLALIYFRYGNFNIHGRIPFPPILIIMLISLITGYIITLYVGKKILSPITDFSNAAKEIANGNFDIHLNESHRVSEISEVAHHFNIMVQELQSIETLRNDFVVNVSHEFKTPIAAIEGYATLLQDKTITKEEHDEYTGMIVSSARQLSTLSGNILKISKLENQEVISDKAAYRLDEQVRQALLLLEPIWSPKELTLNIELAKRVYHGNEELMMQVWLNLLGNAIKFTPEGGEISVSLTSNEHCITVTISDTGIGMTKSVKKHIFEKFYQGDHARSREGNGLGLPLVSRIINLCGGTIDVRSALGEGSTFTVKLPVE